MNSDTPRTDTQLSEHCYDATVSTEFINFARTLERENQQLREALRGCAEALDESFAMCDDGHCGFGKPHHLDCTVAKRDKARSNPIVRAALKDAQPT